MQLVVVGQVDTRHLIFVDLKVGDTLTVGRKREAVDEVEFLFIDPSETSIIHIRVCGIGQPNLFARRHFEREDVVFVYIAEPFAVW